MGRRLSKNEIKLQKYVKKIKFKKLSPIVKNIDNVIYFSIFF